MDSENTNGANGGIPINSATPPEQSAPDIQAQPAPAVQVAEIPMQPITNSASPTTPTEAASTAAPNAQPAAPSAQALSTSTMSASTQSTQAPASKINFIALLIAFFTKPATTIRQESDKLTSFKNVAIITAITAAISSISTALYSVFLAVYKEECEGFFTKRNCKSVWKWENLKDSKVLSTTLWSFVGIIAAIAVVALVFYGISRLMKSTKSNYLRIVAIVSLSILPSVIALSIAPILAKLSASLALFVPMVAYAYATYVLYECVNNEAGFMEDDRIKFATLSALAMAIGAFVLTLALAQMTGLNKLHAPGSNLIPKPGKSSVSDIDDILEGLGY